MFCPHGNDALTCDKCLDAMLRFRKAQEIGDAKTLERINQEMTNYELPRCKCLHCGHEWAPRLPQRPGVCPRCKSYRWDKKPQRKGKEQPMDRTTTEHYTIDPTKLAAIVASVQTSRPMTEAQVRDYCLADWPEGQEHQDWLDSASVSEIADWVIAGQW